MDTTPKQLLATAKKILAELRSLNDNLQKQSEAIAEDRKPREEHVHVAPEVHTLLQFPESVQNDKKAADARNHWYQKANFILAGLTLIALVAYAITTIYIYSATRKAANAAKISAEAAHKAADEAKLSREQNERIFNANIDQFHLDQRAWVGISEEKGKFTIGQPGAAGVTITNSGKTPAVHLHAIIEGRTIPAGQEMTFNHKSPTGIISNTVLQPGAKAGLYTSTLMPMTQMHLDAARSGKATTYFFGTVTYNDIFPPSPVHHTAFCFMLSPDMEHAHDCASHNAAD